MKKIIFLRGCAMALRGLSRACGLWGLIVLSLYFLNTNVPHVRTSERPCTYLGSRGFVQTYKFHACPFLVMLDSRP